MTGPLDEANGDNATVRPQKIVQQQPSKDTDNTVSEPVRKPAPTPNKETPVVSMAEQKSSGTGMEIQDEETLSGAEAFQQDELITMVHAPLSGEQWHAELQRAGKQLTQMANGKKAGDKADDVAQLVCPPCKRILRMGCETGGFSC